MSTLAWLLDETRRELRDYWGPLWPIGVLLGAAAVLAVFLAIVWAVEIAGMLMHG